jgi:hypothetical protein
MSPAAHPVGPIDQISRQGKDTAGVVDDGSSRSAQDPPAALRFEQWNTEPALQLGQALGER